MTSDTMPARSTATIIVGLGIAVLWLNFWGWDLWAPDEPRYAQIAREMVEQGHWLVPHLGGKVYSEKPPLFFWLIAFSYGIFGVDVFAVRIISVLSASGSILLTYFLGKRLFGSTGGICSAMVLSTSVLFIHLGRRANIDATLLLTVTASLALIAKAYFDEKKSLYMPAYLLMAVGVLLKGPVALLLPVVVMLLYFVLIRETRQLGCARLWMGLIIVVVVVGAWLVPASLWGGSDYFNTVVFKQNLGRAVSSFSHKKPVYYYLLQFPPNFFPWIVFFPQALYTAIRNKTRERLFPVVWFAGIFVFFSLMSGKRGLYMLPLFPAAALITGSFFRDILDGTIRRRIVTAAALVLAAALAAVAVAVWFIKIPDYAEALIKLRWPVSLILVAVAALVVTAVARKKQHHAFYAAYALMICLSIYTVLFIFPAFNSFKTARFLCEDLLAQRQDNEDVILYKDLTNSGAYHFYSKLPLIDISDEESLRQRLKHDVDFFIISSKSRPQDYDAVQTRKREV